MGVVMAEGDKKEDQLPEGIENRLGEIVKVQLEEAISSMNQPPKEEPKDKPVDQNEEVRQALNPFIQPGIDDAKFRGDDAKDYASFYIRHPEARENHDEVEKMFATLAQAGRGTTREDINKYIQGKRYVENPDKFVDDEMEKRKKELEKLESSTDIGAGALFRRDGGQVVSIEEFEQLPVDEMEKMMEGFTF